MCVEPTTAMMIGSALSSGLQYKQQKQAQKNQYNAQIRQNDIAKRNAIQRYASEQLKINQQVKAVQQKGYEANLKSKKADDIINFSTLGTELCLHHFAVGYLSFQAGR